MPTAKSPGRSSKPAVVALDLGGTKLAGALFTSEGKSLLSRVVPLADRQGKEVAELVTAEARRLIGAAVRCELNVQAVGVSVPGIATARTGRVWAPNIPGWDDYPLRSEIRSAIRDASIRVIVDNDRAASILGEAWQGAARGCRDAIFLAVGTGIGAGILADGRVLRGHDGIAGAIGWLALDRPFQSEYIACGCFESHASGNGLAKRAKALLAKRKSYRGQLRANRDFTAHEVFQAFEQGDPVAKGVLAEAIEFWGLASANLVSLFNPERIIFGGGVFGPAARFLEAIEREARRWAQPVAIERVKFETSQLGGEAALVGAGYLALRRARLAT